MINLTNLPVTKTPAECKELLDALNSVITGAEAFIAEKIGGTTLSRRVSWPARTIGERFPELKDCIMLFVGIDSESDHLPIDVTYSMTPEFELQVERELAELDKFYREDIGRICRTILDTLPAARTAIQARFEHMTTGWLP